MNPNVYLLAKLINSEANLNDIHDALYIGSVVLNRMRLRNRSMHDIINEPNQFAGVRTQHFKVTEKALEYAHKLLGRGVVNKNVQYFYNPKLATDKQFVRMMNSDKTLVYKSKYHKFFKD